jgi:hypothetical protein
VRSSSARRVWVVLYEDQEVPPGMAAAVAPLRRGDPVAVAGARAIPYAR